MAVSVAGAEMAPLVSRGDVLVPMPDARGSTRANLRLARQISALSGAPVCNALTRRLVSQSSRGRSDAGLSPLTIAAHQMLRLHGCPAGRVVFVDRVAASGGTAQAAAQTLDVPCAVLVWAWNRSSIHPNPTHGWTCIGHSKSLETLPGPWDDADYLELCVGLQYRRPFTNAVLDLRESWPDVSSQEAEKRLEDGTFWWQGYLFDPFNNRWYTIVEKGTAEDIEQFRHRDDALRRLELIARDILDARVPRIAMSENETLEQFLRWFEAQVPNRIDYVRILWANDPNGAYDGLLAEPVREAERAFHETFGEHLVTPAPNPWRDQLPGGLADDLTPVDFDPVALARGTKVELEHTSDPVIATEIAMDHLTEDSDYYEKLATIHL